MLFNLGSWRSAPSMNSYVSLDLVTCKVWHEAIPAGSGPSHSYGTDRTVSSTKIKEVVMSFPRCHNSTSCFYELTVNSTGNWPPPSLLSTVLKRAWSIIRINLKRPEWSGRFVFKGNLGVTQALGVSNNCSFPKWTERSKQQGNFLCHILFTK